MSYLIGAPKAARTLSLFAGPAFAALLAFSIHNHAHAGEISGIPLTLARAQQLAIERSRQLAGQDEAAAASRDMAVAAGRLPDPVLKFGIDNLPVSGADRLSVNSDFMTMRRVGLSQELTGADKRRLRSGRLEREAEKSLAEKEVSSAAIERDTAFAWLDRFYAEAMLTLIREQGTAAQLEVQAADAAYRGGRGSQADWLATRAALVALDDRASEYKLRVRNANTMLLRWAGPAADTSLASAPDMSAIPLDHPRLDAQLKHHPELALLARQQEIARTDVALAKAERKPDWSVEFAYQQRGSAYSNMVSVGLSVPLQWDRKNRQDRELSARLAIERQAGDALEEAQRMHLADIQGWIAEWNNKRERSQRYQDELLPLAKERTAALLAAYRGGKSGLADVLAARRAEIELRLQALQLAADTARLWAQLTFIFPDGDKSTAPAPMPMSLSLKGNTP
ncbi:TolC family protein [Janthinobacterium agaricidamnosum]|nr:TolC family protein [Janthinobacterium agaricidamnosum]